MLLSTLSAPIYVSLVLGALLRRRAGFVVTPKGDSASPDRLATFRTSLRWAASTPPAARFAAAATRTGHVAGPPLNLAHLPRPRSVGYLADPAATAHASTTTTTCGVLDHPDHAPVTYAVEAAPMSPPLVAAGCDAAWRSSPWSPWAWSCWSSNRPMVAARRRAVPRVQHQPAVLQGRSTATGRTCRCPQDFRVNAIHAALLHTGKVLIIAGSGNNRDDFEAGTFRTVLYDPATDEFTDVHTPTDVFCAGHTFLPNGNLLVAGGTKSYEVLENDIKHAAGVMKIKNESPDAGPRVLPKGTSCPARTAGSTPPREDVTVPAAPRSARQHVMITPARPRCGWRPSGDGEARQQARPQYASPTALTGAEPATSTASPTRSPGRSRSTAAQDAPTSSTRAPSGTSAPATWSSTAGTRRWSSCHGGDVLAVSGLDEFGRMLPGDNERLRRTSQQRGSPRRSCKRFFPTYPAPVPDGGRPAVLLRLQRRLRLGHRGAHPGLWDLRDNTFRPVPGLRDPRADRDQLVGAAAAGPGPEGDDPRRRRGRRVASVHGPHRRSPT